MEWHIDPAKSEEPLEEAKEEAIRTLSQGANTCPESWEHVGELRILENSRDRAILYAQWSLATERACILANGTDEDVGAMYMEKWQNIGIGRLPVLQMK